MAYKCEIKIINKIAFFQKLKFDVFFFYLWPTIKIMFSYTSTKTNINCMYTVYYDKQKYKSMIMQNKKTYKSIIMQKKNISIFCIQSG